MVQLARKDWRDLVVIIAVGLGFWVFRELTIVPRIYGSLCTATHPPFICAPRQAVLWAQYERVFGMVALLAGLIGWALGQRLLTVIAMAIGVAAVVNYNGTEGMIGVALGLWGWLGLRTGRYGPAEIVAK